VSAFAHRDLIDEYQLSSCIRSSSAAARRYSPLSERQCMSLITARTFDDSVVGLQYARTR